MTSFGLLYIVVKISGFHQKPLASLGNHPILAHRVRDSGSGISKALGKRLGIKPQLVPSLDPQVGLTAHIQQASVENAVAVLPQLLNSPTPPEQFGGFTAKRLGLL